MYELGNEIRVRYVNKQNFLPERTLINNKLFIRVVDFKTS